MQNSIHDVVVVGAGPVGLMTARLLGLKGHDVVVVERWPEPYPLPRAVHFDDEIGRIFQSAELTEEILAVTDPVPDFYEWQNRHQQPLVRIDWSGTGACGWPVANFFSQPELEAVLLKSVEAMPTVTLMRGYQAVQLNADDEEVQLTVTSQAVKHRVVRGRYVIGCDGANSMVRQHMGTPLHDLGFFFDWLIVDTIPQDDLVWSPMNWQLCDPARPTTIVSGGPGRRRWEFLRLPGETPEQLNTAETAWSLLEPWGRTRANTELERHAVYTFQARWAESWNDGRLLLAGDAAHLMPPFAGQGMCSGMRDAANLSWKLDLVLRGRAQPQLLDTYTSERREHIQHAITMSVELGKVICVLDEDQAAERDARMIAGNADPTKVLPAGPAPVLGPGVTSSLPTGTALRGALSPQFGIRADGQERQLDDVTGGGFVILTDGTGPSEETLAAELAPFDVRVVPVGGAPLDGAPLADLDGVWARWFKQNEIAAVVVRPDFYIFGAVANADELPALIGDLRDQLTNHQHTRSAYAAASSA